MSKSRLRSLFAVLSMFALVAQLIVTQPVLAQEADNTGTGTSIESTEQSNDKTPGGDEETVAGDKDESTDPAGDETASDEQTNESQPEEQTQRSAPQSNLLPNVFDSCDVDFDFPTFKGTPSLDTFFGVVCEIDVNKVWKNAEGEYIDLPFDHTDEVDIEIVTDKDTYNCFYAVSAFQCSNDADPDPEPVKFTLGTTISVHETSNLPNVNWTSVEGVGDNITPTCNLVGGHDNSWFSFGLPKFPSFDMECTHTIVNQLGDEEPTPVSCGDGTSYVVTPSNTLGWGTYDTRPGGTVNYNNDTTAPGTPNMGSLSLLTDGTTAAKSQYMKYFNSLVPLSQVNNLCYYTKQNSTGITYSDPSYQLPVWLDGANPSSFTTFVYEPYQDQGTNPPSQAIVPSVWQQWDVDEGKFWSSKTYQCSEGTITAGFGGAPFYTLADILDICPEAAAIGFGVNVGSNNPSYDVQTDLVQFNGEIYNFEPDQEQEEDVPNLHFIKVACTDLSDIYGNENASNEDQTGGLYTQFGNYNGGTFTPSPLVGGYVNPSEIPSSEDSSCSRMDGWQFSLATNFDHTDNVSLVGPTTGGEYVTPISGGGSALNAAQQDAIVNGQLWVNEVEQDGYDFAAIRCYNDALNGDKDEFISLGEDNPEDIYCIAYNLDKGPQIHFSKYVCFDYSDINGNAFGEMYDATGGHYTEFANYSETEPHFPDPYTVKPVNPGNPGEVNENCSPLSNWQFRLSTDVGQTSTPYYTPGTDVNGEVVMTVSDLPDWLQGVYNGSGLWVSEVMQEGYSFGALRCYNDAINGDNLEVIKFDGQPSPKNVYCIAYNVLNDGGNGDPCPYPNDLADNVLKNLKETFVPSAVNLDECHDIRGLVYHDVNQSWLPDEGDLGLNDWHIRLYTYNPEVDGAVPGNIYLETTSDGSGNYSFNDLLPGCYVVQEVPESGWLQMEPGDDFLYYVALGGAKCDFNEPSSEQTFSEKVLGFVLNTANAAGDMTDNYIYTSNDAIGLNFGNYPQDQGGCTSNCGGGSSSGSSSSGSRTNDSSDNQGQVLGDSTNTPSDQPGKVLGATTLPRTGTSSTAVLVLLIAMAIPAIVGYKLFGMKNS